MSVKITITALTAAVLPLVACTPEPPQYFGPQLAFVPGQPDPAAINSVAYAVRAAPPGRPGYLETIKYIDDGVKYIDQYSQFFISFDGQLCFRGLVNHQLAEFENYQTYWCMYPTAINNVEALENDVSHVDEVRLWCRHVAPQCARRYGYPTFLNENSDIANSVTVQIVPYKSERNAIEYLVYLMGGDATGKFPLREY
jgi:hypothetical protein